MPKIEIVLRRLMIANEITIGEAMALSAAVAFATSTRDADARATEGGTLDELFASMYGTENLAELTRTAPDVVVAG